jgi:L-alanine-DL-glutamate epimerase-like enolase superfamily enzyme
MAKASTVRSVETLSCAAGGHGYYFVKLTTSDGIIGWSEYDESFGPPGITAAITAFAPRVVGKSVMDHERVFAELFAIKRMAFAGSVAMAAGAIENALLDAKAKTLGLPCYDLLGGQMRDRIRVYWSHCAFYRIARPEWYGPPIKDAAGLIAMGREVRDKGFTALKTNIILHENDGLTVWRGGFGGPPFAPEVNVDRKLLRDLRRSLELLREGAGPDVELLIDLNFHAKTEGFLEILRAIHDLDLFWVEIDMTDAAALAYVRDHSPHPIASCETLLGVRQFIPFFDRQAMDVAIIDALWNGAWQAMKIAALADGHEVNIAPHNFNGHLASMISAHFAAAVPNLRIMEIDIDRIAWDEEIFPHPPKFENGMLIVPDTPGWSCDPDEAAIRRRPLKH